MDARVSAPRLEQAGPTAGGVHGRAGEVTMGGHAGHDHDHGATPSRRLAVALIVSLGILALEVVGGLASNSLALLSDAGHVLTDVIAIGLAWFASQQAERPPNARQT